jgi:hypothetical protein
MMPSKRQPPILTHHQRMAARATAQSNRDKINMDIDLILNAIDLEVQRLSLKYHRNQDWFTHQLYQKGRLMRVKRAVSMYNAAKQISGFLAGTKGSKFLPFLQFRDLF